MEKTTGVSAPERCNGSLLRKIEVTEREEAFLRAAQEWAESKLAEVDAEFHLECARCAQSTAAALLKCAESRLERAQMALLTDFESDTPGREL